METVKELVRGLRPDLNVKFTSLRTPITLVRGVRPETAKSVDRRLLAAIRAANVSAPVHATLLHEDADAVEPAHEALIERKEAQLDAAPGVVLAVVPAWEMESWWFQFPESVAKYRPTWGRLDKYAGRHVGKIVNAKEELKRALRSGARQGRAVEYSESDCPGIARVVVSLREYDSPKARSDSWSTFVRKIMAL
ncbi:hypothetical protein [Kineococcus glutinatus]